MSAGHRYANKRHHYGCKRDPIGARDNKRAFDIESPSSKRQHPSPKHTVKTWTPTTTQTPAQTPTVTPVQTPTPAAQSPTATPADDDAADDEDTRPPSRPSRHPFRLSRHPFRLSRRPSPQMSQSCLCPQTVMNPRFLFPLSVDMSQFVAHVHDQGSNNSCTANAVCAAYGIHLKRQNSNFDPSYMFLWYNTRKLRGDEHRNEGASISLTYEAFHKEGVCEESLWPFSQQLNERPGPPVYAAAMVNSIEAERYIEKGANFIRDIELCLYIGNPVVFNFEVHESFERVEEWGDDFVMPTPDVPIEDALHAVVAVGFNRSTKRVKILNSWGTSGWGGKDGYFYMSYDTIESDICCDFWEAPRPTHYPA